MTIPVTYFQSCPVCGGNLTHSEIEAHICQTTARPLQSVFEHPQFLQFEKFFQEKTGRTLSRMQHYWAQRMLAGMSFTLVAPTGIGKTFLGSVFSSYLAKQGKRVYLLVPTTLLLKQIANQMQQWLEAEQLLFYSPQMNPRERESFFQRLAEGQFRVLLTTTAFLSKNFQHLSPLRFDFIFVDDVDAILKASRNVERILQLLGFSEEEIQSATRKEGANHGQLVVSTATARPGRKSALFPRLLGFSIGSSQSTLRNIADHAILCENPTECHSAVVQIIKQMGHGGILYLQRQEDWPSLQATLVKEGIRAAAIFSGMNRKEINQTIADFQEGKIDLLAGVAAPYGLLVRGLDLPEQIGYAVFCGIPRLSVGLPDVQTASPRLILTLASIFKKHERLNQLIPVIPKKSAARQEAQAILLDIFRQKAFHLAVETVVVDGDHIVIPDVTTYLQASGRTSRLVAGGITRGAAFLVDRSAFVQAFLKRAQYFDLRFQAVDCHMLAAINFKALKYKIEESRKTIPADQNPPADLIQPALFVVESPTKARQISRFFGRPSMFTIDGHPFYEIFTGKYLLVISASLGHVTELVENGYFYGVEISEKDEKEFTPIYGPIKKCRTDQLQFIEPPTCPRCGNPPDDDARKRLRVFGQVAHLCGLLLLGTDPDTEGEKISWDIANLSSAGMPVSRAEFHEVTRSAILQALSHPRQLNENLVRAQIVRRIADRWIGFVLSELIQQQFQDKNLSAGRAQTPLLHWIIERFHEHQKKIREAFVTLNGIPLNLGEVQALGIDEKPQLPLVTVLVEEIKSTEEKATPLPPYSTDSALKDITRFVKISSDEAMRILQELFENGLITYHRTDSTRVSERGLEVARQYLETDFVARRWESGKEGAHECIRPTRPVDAATLRDFVYQGIYSTSTAMTTRHLKTYDLIFRRFMASQTPHLLLQKKIYQISIPQLDIRKTLERVIAVHGRAAQLFPEQWHPERELPVGKFEVPLEIRTRPAAPLLTQGEAIALMKERGIGRPSTYATLLKRLFQRHYIIEKRQKLIPTRRGMEVDAFLQNHFRDFISEERTRLLEAWMDQVESGEQDYQKILNQLYQEILPIFHQLHKSEAAR